MLNDRKLYAPDDGLASLGFTPKFGSMIIGRITPALTYNTFGEEETNPGFGKKLYAYQTKWKHDVYPVIRQQDLSMDQKHHTWSKPRYWDRLAEPEN